MQCASMPTGVVEGWKESETKVVRTTWRRSAGLRGELCSLLDVLDEVCDIRWCGCPDGRGHMASFLAPQVRVCEAFGVEVPAECHR